ncbi:glycosyltransferase family 2 protein [Flavobacteriaceae bacterium MHTCC 0001]
MPLAPQFSVIVPLYNKENYIKNTIGNVLNQTFKNFEIIVVNDGSTDRSLDVISRIEDKRIKIINQENKGVSVARNKGIVSANAQYIVFLDADDLWFTNHLEELKLLVNDFPNCGMYCSRYKTKISHEKIINNSFSYSIQDNFRGIVPNFFEASLVNRVAFTSALMIPKKIFKECGMFDINLSNGEDWDLWVRIALHYKVAITSQVTAIYRFEISNSLSKIKFSEKKTLDFKKFECHEKRNSSLKLLLDIYRLEYALQYRISNNIEQSKALLKEINNEIPIKAKILLKLPPSFLSVLLRIKHYLKSKGISFTVYH